MKNYLYDECLNMSLFFHMPAQTNALRNPMATDKKTGMLIDDDEDGGAGIDPNTFS